MQVGTSGIKLQKDGFSISIPDGWIEIPADIIEANEREAARLAPNFPAQHYDFGFQLASSENWLEYPYILVQIKNTSRIPERQLEKFEGYSVQESIDKHKKGLSSIASDIQAGKMAYDKQTKFLNSKYESKILVLSSCFFNEKLFTDKG